MCQPRPALRCKTDAFKSLRAAEEKWTQAQARLDAYREEIRQHGQEPSIPALQAIQKQQKEVEDKKRVYEKCRHEWELTALKPTESAEAYIKEYEGYPAKSAVKCEKLRSELAEEQQVLASAQERLPVAEAELDAAKEKRVELDERLHVATETRKDLSTRLAQLKAENRDTKAVSKKLEAQKTVCAELSKERSAQVDACASLTNELKALREETKVSEQRVNELSKRLADEQAEGRKVEERLERERQHIATRERLTDLSRYDEGEDREAMTAKLATLQAESRVRSNVAAYYESLKKTGEPQLPDTNAEIVEMKQYLDANTKPDRARPRAENEDELYAVAVRRLSEGVELSEQGEVRAQRAKRRAKNDERLRGDGDLDRKALPEYTRQQTAQQAREQALKATRERVRQSTAGSHVPANPNLIRVGGEERVSVPAPQPEQKTQPTPPVFVPKPLPPKPSAPTATPATSPSKQPVAEPVRPVATHAPVIVGQKEHEALTRKAWISEALRSGDRKRVKEAKRALREDERQARRDAKRRQRAWNRTQRGLWW